MSLKVVGKIYPQDVHCIKCNDQIKIYGKPDEMACGCGANYSILKAHIVDQQVEMEYKFMGFVCVQSGFNSNCKNPCPAPNMYCKEHCSDEAIASAKRDIEYAEQRMVQNKNKLASLEESKKTWLINQMSGLNEQDNSVSEN